MAVHSREIEEILDTCRPHRSRRVLIFERPGTGGLAVIVGKRVGGAVARNRARRVLRAAWSDVAPVARELDVVLVARGAIAGARSQEVAGEMRSLMDGASAR